MALSKRLLWVDCTAALVAGVAVLLLNRQLNTLYALPSNLLYLNGIANLAYASYSFSLAIRARRPMPLIYLLVALNTAWVILCLILAVAFWTTATPFGILHLVGEAVFVGGLAILEWNRRQQLLTADES